VGRRLPARLVALAPLFAALFLLLPGVASAHAQLVSLDPADGAPLETSPAVVTLTFNEPVGLATGGLQVLDSAGAVVDDGPDQLDGPTVRQPLPPLPAGWYVVIWGVVSEDGHIVRASSVFAVGDADAAARPDASSGDVSWLSGAARAAGDLGLLVAAGAWAAWFLLRARRPAVRRLVLGATLLALAGSAVWALIEAFDGGSAWLGTSAAVAALARLVLLAGALLAARSWPGVAAALTGMALITLAGGGHSAADPFSVALLSAHLAAAVVWLGAAPAVLLVMRDPSVSDADAVDVVRRFSRLAGFALVAVGAAGVALAWNLSDGLAGGLVTPWVLLLGAKVACVGFAALLGAWGRGHLGGALDRRRLRRLFALDASLFVTIAILSATLTLTSPHTGHAGHAGHDTTGDSSCSTVVGATSVAVIATPGRVGSNDILVGGVPADIRSVTLSFRHELTQGGALTMTASPESDVWRASGALPLEGSWEATIALRLDTFTEERGTCHIVIEP